MDVSTEWRAAFVLFTPAFTHQLLSIIGVFKSTLIATVMMLLLQSSGYYNRSADFEAVIALGSRISAN